MVLVGVISLSGVSGLVMRLFGSVFGSGVCVSVFRIVLCR